MFRLLLLPLIASSAQAALIESDWGPSQTISSGRLSAQDGKMHYVIPIPSTPVWDMSARTWDWHPTLDADWSVQATVHLNQLSLTSLQNASIGFGLARQHGLLPGLDNGLVRLALKQDANFGRFVSAGFRLTSFAGRGTTEPFSDADVMLRMTFLASERLVRTYYGSPGGRLRELDSVSVQGWGIASGEALNLYLSGHSHDMTTIGGEAYVSDFAFVPEVISPFWLSVALLVRRRSG